MYFSKAEIICSKCVHIAGLRCSFVMHANSKIMENWVCITTHPHNAFRVVFPAAVRWKAAHVACCQPHSRENEQTCGHVAAVRHRRRIFISLIRSSCIITCAFSLSLCTFVHDHMCWITDGEISWSCRYFVYYYPEQVINRHLAVRWLVLAVVERYARRHVVPDNENRIR